MKPTTLGILGLGRMGRHHVRCAREAQGVELTRHMVTIASGKGVRQVHYRRQGRGPAVLMLHQSPQSSREFEPLMAEWATDFTVFAPDTPGYGLSDPLADTEASMEDIAQAGEDRGELEHAQVVVKALEDNHAMAYGEIRLKFKDGSAINSWFSTVYVNTPFGWKAILTHN